MAGMRNAPRFAGFANGPIASADRHRYIPTENRRQERIGELSDSR